MDQEELSKYYTNTLADNPGMSEAVAAIKTLLELIRTSDANTLMELDRTLTEATKTLVNTEKYMIASVTSGCEIFVKFITRTAKLELKDFKEIKKVMVDRGTRYFNQVVNARETIAREAINVISSSRCDNILVHSRSRAVLEVLKAAAKANKNFTVYVTESLPDRKGKQMYEDLKALDIPAVLILDAAVGYIMERISYVFLGAESVCQSGGIISKIGTHSIAMIAKSFNVKVYVMAETFKFNKMYPLNQKDIPDLFKYGLSPALMETHPMVDYTDESYIELVFTDIGALTPPEVCDELFKLYI